ncbi:MAG: heme-binding protein [Planctomycetes bacterium]|nr:heme-binding protein [Planctomycetota bacterium]
MRARSLRNCGALRLAGWSVLCTFVLAPASCHREGDGDDLTPSEFPVPADPLTTEEVRAVLERAAESLDASSLIVAVVDRVGRVLGTYRRDPAASDDDLNVAVAIARAAAFLSSSQGPLSSRTLEFISTFHFPPTFGDVEPLPSATLPPQRQTTGVRNTPQGPLWQIFTSNRGGPLGGGELPSCTPSGTESCFNAGQAIPRATRIDGTAPGPGLGYLPGGIPLYKDGRLAGGVGCFGPAPEACEFAALEGAGPLGFAPIRPEGAILLVGVLLPYVEQTARPSGFGPGSFDAADLVQIPAGDGTDFQLRPGVVDPEGYLIGPRADPLGNLSQAEVETMVDQAIDTADGTRAAIRLPLGTTTKMVIAITNLDGLVLALFRMPDAPIFSIDVAVTKARAVVYYSGPDLDPSDAIPGLPAGTAITTRTLGFLSQPFYPPNIHHTGPGPLFHVALENQDPVQYNRMGQAAFSDGLQSGIIFFPGSAPLYKAGTLVGGLGISGDGVEQDDFVTAGAVRGFEPPAAIRADNYSFGGVKLPYFKFPQLTGPGAR